MVSVALLPTMSFGNYITVSTRKSIEEREREVQTCGRFPSLKLTVKILVFVID
jgi:hypothetical protein